MGKEGRFVCFIGRFYLEEKLGGLWSVEYREVFVLCEFLYRSGKDFDVFF